MPCLMACLLKVSMIRGVPKGPFSRAFLGDAQSRRMHEWAHEWPSGRGSPVPFSPVLFLGHFHQGFLVLRDPKETLSTGFSLLGKLLAHKA